jgi:glycosyltransferase involved in cell wall biosynthesis
LLVVSQYYYPEQFRINDMCEEWVKRGYDVTVVTGIPNYPKGKFFDGYGWFKRRKETHNGVKIIRLPIISRGSSNIRLGLNYISFVISGFFWKMFTKQQADLVFSFEVSPMTQVLPAVWFAKRCNIPCIAYIQDLWPENFIEMTGIKSGPIIRIIDRMTDYIYKNCHKILVTSNSFKQVVENRGIPAEKVDFWPQYAEDFYKPSDITSSPIPKDDVFTIAFTGNIGYAQGLEILPEAAELLKKQGEKVRFLLVGDGRALVSLRKTIQQKTVEEYFLFLPRQNPEDIPSILAGADAAFLSFAPSSLFSKTIPAKMQSYMACGMPILAVASGETRQVIEEAKCGVTCRPGDAEALCDAIVDFISLPSNRIQEFSDNSLQYANMHFSKQKLMDEMDNYFVS